MTGFRLSRSDLRFLPQVPLLPDRWLYRIMAVSALFDGILLYKTRLEIDATPAALALGVWAIAAVVACYCLRAPANPGQRIARDLVEGISLFGFVSLLGAVATYPLAAGQHPLVDPELQRIDLSLHFNWLVWYEWVARHVWLQFVERTAYHSIFVTPAVLIGYFAWNGRRADSRLFVATFWVAVVITLSLFPLLPAAGPFSTLWRGAAPYPYMPLSALYQDQVILALRHHAMHSIDLGELHGLVCAPSFHAASAVIYIATAWRIRLLRWPLITLNAIMLGATPVEGTHYLTDLLAGAAVAGVALWLAPLLVRWSEQASGGWPAGFETMAPVAAE